MKWTVSAWRVIWISILTEGIIILHYTTHLTNSMAHSFYREMFFLPLLLAAFWFGIKGGVAVSISITALFLPFISLFPEVGAADRFDSVMTLVILNVLGVIVGWLRDRDLIQQRRLRETEALAAMGTAVSALAHDLKNPLVAIGGYANSVKKSLNPDDPNSRKLELVVRQTRRLETMIQDMLNFSKPMNLSRSATDINGVLKETADVIQEEAQRRNVEIQLNLEESGILAEVDAMRLEQALINLVANAVQASPEGESVILSARPDGKVVVIEITDRGHGIPEKSLGEIFTPFFSTKSDGVGLGLPIVKKIIEAHRGRIDCWNNARSGATFRISLPQD